MEIKITLDKYADISFIKKLLSQIKGISNVEILQDDRAYSWEEIENSEVFQQFIEKGRKQIEEGQFEEHSTELLDTIFEQK